MAIDESEGRGFIAKAQVEDALRAAYLVTSLVANTQALNNGFRRGMLFAIELLSVILGVRVETGRIIEGDNDES